MRAPIFVLTILLLFASVSLVPTAAAEQRPGCDERLSVEEVCDLYATRDWAGWCAKNLRYCLFGPI